MANGVISKVMKFELRYKSGCVDFHTMQKELWELQREVRKVLNRTIQICYHWDYESYQHYLATGAYKDLFKETGYKRIDGYAYDEIKNEMGKDLHLSSSNFCAAVQIGWKKYVDSKQDVMLGAMSLPSFREDQPIPVSPKSIKLPAVYTKDPVISISLFSNGYKLAGSVDNISFGVVLGDGTQRAIFERLVNGQYKLGRSQIKYIRPKDDSPKWMLYVTYSFVAAKQNLDPGKVLGVQMGEVYAIYASSKGQRGSLRIDGGEVTAFASRIEARVRDMQHQTVNCGNGRVGHGTKTRVAPAYKMRNKVANFRDTINHRYSHKVVEYAVQNGYGVIQMEDLSGIKQDGKEELKKKLRHWTYYDLQDKICQKAQAMGISVVKINPAYTSLRCSACGHISEDNRKSQADFHCVSCGKDMNADFNASQNISIPDIETIIETTADRLNLKMPTRKPAKGRRKKKAAKPGAGSATGTPTP